MLNPSHRLAIVVIWRDASGTGRSFTHSAVTGEFLARIARDATAKRRPTQNVVIMRNATVQGVTLV